MLFHVGIYLSLNKNYFIFYEAKSKVTKYKILEKFQWSNPLISHEKINIKEVEDKVKKIFDEIQGSCPGELGCCCITLYAQDNISRKILIDFGIQYGFFKVEIMDSKTSFYLHAICKSLFQPFENDLIFIFQEHSCDIWKIWKNTPIFIKTIIECWSKLEEFREFLQDYANINYSIQNVNENMNALKPKILYSKHINYYHKLFIMKWFRRYPIYEYQIDPFQYSFYRSTIWEIAFRGTLLNEKKLMAPLLDYGGVINARIMAKDAELIQSWNIQSMSDRDIVIKTNDSEEKILFSYKRYETLPLKICIKMLACINLNIKQLIIVSKLFTFTHERMKYFVRNRVLEIVDEALADSITERIEKTISLNNDDAILLTIDIDKNGIISHDCESIVDPAQLNIDHFIQKYYRITLAENQPIKTNFINLTLNLLKQNTAFSTFYQFPKLRPSTINNATTGIGIHFGTTNCCAAVIRPTGKIETVALDSQERMLPAYVSFDGEKALCGQLVIKRLNQAAHFAKTTVFDAKQIIGKHFSQIKINQTWPFKIVEDDNRIKLNLQGQNAEIVKYPEEICAALFKQIKEKSEEFQGKILPEVIITVPVEFNNEQNDAIYASALLAGWKRIYFIPEPVAATFAYFMKRLIPTNSMLFLFNLGGATLDICIFKIENDGLKLAHNSRAPHLGGRDFDNVLVEFFMKKLNEDFGIQVNDRKRYKLILECLTIKETLSEENEFYLDVGNYDVAKDDCFITVTREDFENLSKNLINKIQFNIYKAIEKQDPNDIDKVLYVGGGCKMPMIKQLLKEMFPNAEHCCEQNPNEVMAIGAASYNYHLHSNQEKTRCSIM